MRRPMRRRSSSASSFGFDRRLFEDDVTGSIAWARALAERRRAVAPTRRGQIEAALTRHPRARPRRSGVRRAAPTKTCTASSSGCSSSGSATPGAGCIPAARATSRSRSICVCICGAAFRCCSGRWPRVVAALAGQARGRGRCADAGVHALPAGAAGARRAFLPRARRAAAPRLRSPRRRRATRPTRCRSAPARLPARATPIDVDALARDLGFSRVVANSIDASSDRDFAATFLYACALTMVHLSRLAEDLIILCGDEHRFFELSDALSTGSSMMPQKKNPDPLELVRGKTGRAIGHLVGAADDDEGAAERVQQGPAGRQGGGVRRGRHARGLPRRRRGRSSAA